VVNHPSLSESAHSFGLGTLLILRFSLWNGFLRVWLTTATPGFTFRTSGFRTISQENRTQLTLLARSMVGALQAGNTECGRREIGVLTSEIRMAWAWACSPGMISASKFWLSISLQPRL
jgi:hypothetical protein